MKRNLVLALSGLIAVGGFVQSAEAVTVYGLTTRDQLVRFDSATPAVLQQASFITGLAANESLVGFDFRPNGGVLYGVGSFGRLYTINTGTGVASFVAGITDAGGNAIALSGSEFGVDFNPVPDRLRVTSNLGQNLRINVATGVAIVDGALNQGVGTPSIVASAYTNSFAGATSTTLYNIDSVSNSLTIQNPPNAGTQVTVGGLGDDVTALAGMDIFTAGSTNTAYAALQLNGLGGSLFATIDLNTGLATFIDDIGNNQTSDSMAIRDISVQPVPEPASMIALALGAGAMLRRKKK